MVFSISSISRVYKLNKSKATWLPAPYNSIKNNKKRNPYNSINYTNVTETTSCILENSYMVEALVSMISTNNCQTLYTIQVQTSMAANLVGVKDKIELKFFNTSTSSQCFQPNFLQNLRVH